jgi:radical SAM superfamily enzyme YgiQ (UPF0313 family)
VEVIDEKLAPNIVEAKTEPSLVASEKTEIKEVKEVKDHLVLEPIKDLRSAIGINDKFQFIQELFAGDEKSFEVGIKTINAFKLLRENNIKRTAYNIIGLPNQNENSILKTIEFNKVLNPDNITVAYYSPYYGTKSQKKGNELGLFEIYETDVDSALRSKSKAYDILPVTRLDYYKKQFVSLVRNDASQ